MAIYWRNSDATLVREDGAAFDGRAWRWNPPQGGVGHDPAGLDPAGLDPAGLVPISAGTALARLSDMRALRPVPVGVIGPRTASAIQLALADELGRALAGLGLPVLCGGKNGVMEAVAAGVEAAGGLCIGLIPEDDWRLANPHVLPIATGIGKARNVLIAQASRALIAVGGELGTLTEIAFGLHFGKPVFALDTAPEVAGLRRMPNVDVLCEALAAELLGGAAAS